MTRPQHRRRAGGLARTFVVAVATLAILLVCFSMYQYSQVAPPVALTPRSARLPIPGEIPPPPHPASSAEPSGVNVDGAVIGTSKNVTISLYPREGRESKLELTVSDWSPREGSDHEFILRDPEIRMRTAEGNDLRVKADEGTLEARRKSGSGLEPQRGKLTGNVIIEFDRRSQEDKAKLSEAERTATPDYDLVRIQAEELQFDVEFGRLIIPGKIVLTARDASLQALDLEMQFDQQENRIESLRIERGGRIELLSQNEALGTAMGNRGAEPRKQTIAEWIRQTLQARIDAQSAGDAQKAEAARQTENASATKAHPSLPLFRTAQPPRARTAAHYVGRFEGDVDARQQLGDVTQSRLQADWLEILRELSVDERKSAASDAATSHPGAAQTSATPTAAERIVLTWTGKLVVNQAPTGDVTSEPALSSRLTAGGTPARFSHPEGDAICSRLVYLPDTGDVQLIGEGSKPVVVRSVQQGTVMGQSVSLRQTNDSIDIAVDGPGQIWGEAGTPTSTPLLSAHTADLGPANIDFANGLKAVGRVLKKATLDFTGSITTREYRLLDRVTFGGRTTLRQDDTELQADRIEVDFSVTENWRGVQQTIDHVIGTGNVLMTQADDRLTCDKMDIAMGAGSDGNAVITSATAMGFVSAIQGDRALQASEKLIVDFGALPATDVVKVADTTPASSIPGSSSTAAGSSLKFSSAAAPRRLRAFGEVSVIDPSQSLDLTCEQLDCTIALGKDIESAVLAGLPDRPASVNLDTFSVTGKDITLDVLNEWAEVPGQGRMTIQSQKDLDGRKVAQPIPIAITWTAGMKYRGRENRAIFSGKVHASSQATTTFDCDDNLLVEFEDAPAVPAKSRRSPIHWGVAAPLGAAAQALDAHLGPQLEKWGVRVPLNAFLPGAQSTAHSVLRGFTKEPRYIEATGNAVAQTADLHPVSGFLKSRARISGPKLSLHLRSELSKMLIEGPGDLLLEDFQAAKPAESSTPQSRRADLFSDQSDAGPSKTLIKWRDRMWYDFGIDQTLFEGAVHLTHLSGIELDKVFGVPQGGTPSTAKGRRTFLASDALTVDFTDAPRSARRDVDQRMGRISSDRLRRFRAHGNVVLREEVDQFSLHAEDVTYERPRKTLMILGAAPRKAQLTRQRPGKLPDQMAAERIFYNLETGKIQISRPEVKTGQ